MTGPGTNTYLVGIDEVAVIDPGPDVAKHVESIVGAAMRDRVQWVLLTHTHPDHWPAADAHPQEDRRAIVGAFGKFPKADEVTLELDLVLADGDTIDGTEFRLEALHTPGPRAEPPVLLARRGAHAVHRRPRAQRHDHGREPAARRRHGRSTSRRSNGCARSSGSRASAPATAT